MTRSGHRLPVRPPGESTERIVAAAARAEASAAVRAEGVERADLSVIGGATAASASTPTGNSTARDTTKGTEEEEEGIHKCMWFGIRRWRKRYGH